MMDPSIHKIPTFSNSFLSIKLIHDNSEKQLLNPFQTSVFSPKIGTCGSQDDSMAVKFLAICSERHINKFRIRPKLF